MRLLEHGEQKYPGAEILTTSKSRGWAGLAAELRSHQPCELPTVQLQHMEVAIATRCDQNAMVSRTGDGISQETRVQPGTIWLCEPPRILRRLLRLRMES